MLLIYKLIFSDLTLPHLIHAGGVGSQCPHYVNEEIQQCVQPVALYAKVLNQRVIIAVNFLFSKVLILLTLRIIRVQKTKNRRMNLVKLCNYQKLGVKFLKNFAGMPFC